MEHRIVGLRDSLRASPSNSWEKEGRPDLRDLLLLTEKEGEKEGKKRGKRGTA